MQMSGATLIRPSVYVTIATTTTTKRLKLSAVIPVSLWSSQREAVGRPSSLLEQHNNERKAQLSLKERTSPITFHDRVSRSSKMLRSGKAVAVLVKAGKKNVWVKLTDVTFRLYVVIDTRLQLQFSFIICWIWWTAAFLCFLTAVGAGDHPELL